MKRVLHIANLSIFLIALLAIVIALNFFARQDQFRQRFDATKTRAYSLSEQTQRMLSDLQGQWKIAIILNERAADRAMRRQIDEVLSRYSSASASISVVRIDPSDPRTLIEYESLLGDLNRVYGAQIAEYDKSLDEGLQSFAALQSFAQQQAGRLEHVVGLLPADDPVREPLRQRVNSLSILADQGGQIRAAVEKARRVDESKPLPDYETARSTLAAALSQSSGDIDELAEILARWAQRTNVTGAAKEFIVNAQRESQQMALQLAETADQLKHLPALELATIGAQLQQGEAALIVSPNRAAVIPSAQLFPKSNIAARNDGGVSFDQRFRGEQVISAAIRALHVPQMPRVVFVHAVNASLLTANPSRVDLSGVSAMLKISRFDVAEWMVQKSTAPPESSIRNQPTVWIVVPPPMEVGPEQQAAALKLADAVASLIRDGAPVMLNVNPNPLARSGESSPVELLPAPFGLKADAGRIILEKTGTTGSDQISTDQMLMNLPSEHAIARAVNGQTLYLPIPVALQIVPNAAGDGTHHVIAAIEPKPTRWLERDWLGRDMLRQVAERADPTQGQPLTLPAPVVIAAERSHPSGPGRQRFMLIGAGGWLSTNIADDAVALGGGRLALTHPGNYELLLSSVAWLAGMDELIAAGPIGQEVARLQGITPEAWRLWMWIALAGIPGACVVLGVVVWVIRRR